MLKILLEIALLLHLLRSLIIEKPVEQVASASCKIFLVFRPWGLIWISITKYKMSSQVMPPNSNSKHLIDMHWKGSEWTNCPFTFTSSYSMHEVRSAGTTFSALTSAFSRYFCFQDERDHFFTKKHRHQWRIFIAAYLHVRGFSVDCL